MAGQLTQYFVAATLDGFIADEHDNLDWLLAMPGGEDEANPYSDFIKEVGAVAMGAAVALRAAAAMRPRRA